MKGQILKLYFISLMVVISCDKEEDQNIFYVDFNPDKIVTSMITIPTNTKFNDGLFVSGGSGGNGSGPNSIIGSAEFKFAIDLNSDAIEDYNFIVSHYFENATGEQNDKDNFMIYLGSTNFNEISMEDQPNGYIKKYMKGDELEDDSFGHNFRYTLNQPGSFLIKKDLDDNLVNTGEFYIGLKMTINDEIHYGWILIDTQFSDLTLTVKEYGLSKIPNIKIKVGEKN